MHEFVRPVLSPDSLGNPDKHGRMRIALVAYACEPDRGSEPGVGWKWARELVRRGHEVVVFAHSAQRAAIEQSEMRAPLGARFVFHNPRGRPLEHPNRLVTQFQYTSWQWSVMDAITCEDLADPFDVVHFLTWGGIRMPVFGWRGRAPYVIGPVGGGEECPLAYSASLGRSAFLRELGRKLVNRLCLIDPLLWRAYGGAAHIYSKTEDSRRFVPAPFRGKCDVEMEIGTPVEPDDREAAIPLRDPAQPFRIIFVGRLLHWKSPLTVVHVYDELRQRGVDAELLMIGDGPQRALLEEALARLPVDAKVSYHPAIEQTKLFKLYGQHDLMLFPSLHDSSGNVVLEALTFGLPVVALALGGPRELLKTGGGIAVPVQGRNERAAVAAMADEIEHLAASPGDHAKLRRQAREAAAQRSWSHAVERVYVTLEARYSRPAVYAVQK